MTMSPIRRRAAAAAALAASGALLLSACGSGGGDGASGGGSSAKPAGSKAPLFSKLPKQYQKSKKIVVGSNAAYAPNEFIGTDGKSVIGFDKDMGDALGKELGVTFEFKNYDFDGLVPAVNSKRLDLVMSSMTDTKERQQQVDFVDYFKVGTSIMVAKDNPHHITSLDDLCGRTVALQKATTQEGVADQQAKKCKARGKPMKVIALKDDTDALLQLKQGRSVADLNDYPVAQYNAQQSKGSYQVVGAQITPGLYGIGVSKKNPGLRDAVEAALKASIKNGSYDKVVAKWKLEKGKVSRATVNAGK